MTIRNALILAAVILLASLAATLAENNGIISSDTQQRAMGAIIGLALVIPANFAPKSLEPMCARCDPARTQALQRFSGWTLVFAGVGYSLAWLVVPFERARLVAMSIVAAGVGLVMIRLAWVVFKSRGPQPRPSPGPSWESRCRAEPGGSVTGRLGCRPQTAARPLW